ncbi:MAG: hypothetical protein IJS96_07290 [Schwartzia sp.]|nr:hypothetical protein [Schwartzia sp. (in: firmicutes)]
MNMLNAWDNSMKQAENKGKDSERVKSIRSLMETLGLTAKQAMDALKIPAAEQEKYAARV